MLITKMKRKGFNFAFFRQTHKKRPKKMRNDFEEEGGEKKQKMVMVRFDNVPSSN